MLHSEVLTKSRAAKSKRYGAFFTYTGKFKRQSVAFGSVEALRKAALNKARRASDPTEVSIPAESLIEGATRKVTVNAYERSASARALCLEHFGYRCAICDMSFEDTYGTEAAGFIHVHHRKKLSSIKQAYKVRPKQDLVPVCPNCHADPSAWRKSLDQRSSKDDEIREEQWQGLIAYIRHVERLTCLLLLQAMVTANASFVSIR